MPESETHRQASARLVADRYLLLRELGRGGMGIVWLAEDQRVHRQAAVKELRPPPELAGDELAAFRRRALQEATSAARIHHQNAVTLYDVLPATADDGAIYLIMELIDGATLAQLIRRAGPLPAPDVARYGLQLLDVLEAAHAQRIVHRDVKPANVMITTGGQVKLTDFGIAHSAGDTRLTRNGVMGTQAYMAPELYDSGPITPAADLWSLGATLYAAAEGHGPFERDNTGATLRAVLIDDIPRPACSPRLAVAITGLLQRDPARRLTIKQARARLRQAAAEPAAARMPPKRPSADPATGDKHATRKRRAAGNQSWEDATTKQSKPPPANTAPRKPVDTTGQSGTSQSRRRRSRIVGRVVSAGFLAALVAIVVYSTTHSGPSGPGLPRDVRAVLRTKGGDPGSITFTSGGGKVLATDAGIGRAWLWNAATGKQISSLSVSTVAAISPDGSTIAFGNSHYRVELWSVTSRSPIHSMSLPGAGPVPESVAISPDGHTLAVGGLGGPQVYLYRLSDDKLAATLTNRERTGEVDTVLFSPDGSLLAAADNNAKKIFIWNLASHRQIATLTLPEASGTCGYCAGPGLNLDWMAFSHDGGTLAVADQQKGVMLWNVATRTWRATTIPNDFPGDQDAIAFSPDDKTLAIGTGSGAITLWNVASGKPVSTLQEPGGQSVDAIAFSPDDKTLATGDRGEVYLWNLTAG